MSRVFKGRIPGLPGCPEAGLAATRDASWYRKPGAAYVVHMVADDGGSECCGMPLVLDRPWQPEKVPEKLRCRRNGCKGKWPAA